MSLNTINLAHLKHWKNAYIEKFLNGQLYTEEFIDEIVEKRTFHQGDGIAGLF